MSASRSPRARHVALTFAGALLLAPLVTGCGDEGSGGGGEGGAGAPGAQTAGATGSAAMAKVAGTYEISSAFDLTKANVFPEAANKSFRALSQLHDDPAATMVDLLRAFHVPILSTVLDIVPGAVVEYLQGWINDFVKESLYKGNPALEAIAKMADDGASMVTHFEMVSELTIPEPDAAGNALATHALTGVAFTFGGQRDVVKVPSLLGAATQASGVPLSAVHILERSERIEDGRVDVGAHLVGLPLGGFVKVGMDTLAKKRFGTDNLRSALGEVLDCGAMATYVGTSCVGPVCVGHEAEIAQLCRDGLDVVVRSIHDELDALQFGLKMEAGDARLWDAATTAGARDGAVDRLDKGEWTVKAKYLTGERAMEADFTGRRLR